MLLTYTMKFLFHYFSGSFVPFELRILVGKDKGIDVHICRNFLANDFLRVICLLSNSLICVINADHAIIYSTAK